MTPESKTRSKTAPAVAPTLATTLDSGIPLISPKSPLTRLNYFDGKFLRAADLFAEQAYHRKLVALSNRSEAPGVVYGLDATLEGDAIRLGAGLAINADGQVLLLPDDRVVSIDLLLEASANAARKTAANGTGSGEFDDCELVIAPPVTVTPTGGATFYLLSVCPIEALCGEEDVFGRLCEEACVSSTERPFRIDGLTLRATALTLDVSVGTRLALKALHYRSLAAHRYYESERTARGRECLISGEGLKSDVWCSGAEFAPGACVPLAILARAGTTTLFLDEWIARRERIEESPRRYWAWRMCMRPWNVFLAQVLQFQCQLHELLENAPEVGGEDPCAPQRAVVRDALAYFEEMATRSAPSASARTATRTAAAGSGAPITPALLSLPGGLTRFESIRKNLAGLLKTDTTSSSQILIDHGMLWTPPAGYLWVDPASTLSVNEQVRRLLGNGLDLRFCVVRHDFVPHAFEEAQHMDRISLLQGIDDPSRKEAVDVLVPGGAIERAKPGTDDFIYDAKYSLQTITETARLRQEAALVATGVARDRILESGGRGFYFAGASDPKSVATVLKLDAAETEVLARSIRDIPGFDDALRLAAADARRTNLIRAFAGSSGTGASTGQARDPIAVVWTSLEIDRNLTTMSVQETATIAIRSIVLHDSSDGQTGIDERADYRFTLQRIEEAPEKRILSGLLRRSLLVTETFGGAEPKSESEPPVVYSSATLTISGDVSAGAIEFAASQEGQSQIHLSRTWKDGDSSAFDLLGLLARSTFQSHFDLTPNDALISGGRSRDEAVQALDVLEREQRLSRVEAEADLFAPLHRGDSGIVVRATQDWVLFHRRRRKDCGVLPVALPVEPSRKYHVFEITVNTKDEADRLARLLKSTVTSEQTTLRKRVQAEDKPHLVVEFEGGTTRMLTSTQAVAQSWSAFTPGPKLAYAYISRPNGELAQEEARLGVVVAAIPRGTATGQTDTSAVLESSALPVMPPSIADQTTDGSILFITIKAEVTEVKVECHRVYEVLTERERLTHSDWPNVAKIVRGSSSAAAIKQQLDRLFAERIRLLGRARFEQGTANPIAPSVAEIVTKWKETGANAQLLGVGLWTIQRDPLLEPHKAQAGNIASAIGSPPAETLEPVSGPVEPAAVVVANDDAPDRCPTITFLFKGAPG
jgi:hypothetical protein